MVGHRPWWSAESLFVYDFDLLVDTCLVSRLIATQLVARQS